MEAAGLSPEGEGGWRNWFQATIEQVGSWYFIGDRGLRLEVRWFSVLMRVEGD